MRGGPRKDLLCLPILVLVSAFGLAGIALVSPAGMRAASSGSVLPESYRLAELPRETSVFLLNDLTFPYDGKQRFFRENGEQRRVDLYQNGARVARVRRDQPHCEIVSRIEDEGFVEHIKRLQVAEISLAPVPSLNEQATHATAADPSGVGLNIKSVQESAILRINCFAAANPSRAAGGLTIATLHSSLGHSSLGHSSLGLGDSSPGLGTTASDVRVALLAPIAPEQLPVSARHLGNHGHAYYRDALTERSPSSSGAATAAPSLQEAHRAYLRYLEALKPIDAAD